MDATNLLSRMHLTVRSLLLVLALTLGAGALAAACGGGDDEPEATATAAPEEDASPTPKAAAAEDSVDVNESFWHAGWKVTLEEAAFSPDDEAVTIAATFENLGEDTATFDSQLVLTAGGENYTEPTLDQEFPRVPGLQKGNGTITFRVDESFDFDDATLTVGNPSNNQATVPIGPNGDALVSLEPVEIAVTGTATAGAVTLNVTGAELRADLPGKHSEVKKGNLVLIFKFSATPGTGIPIGEGLLASENVLLKLPDGTAVAVRDDGVSGVNELLQGREGTTIQDLSARFEIPAPAAGNYAFGVRGKYVADRSTVEGELPFVIPATADKNFE